MSTPYAAASADLVVAAGVVFSNKLGKIRRTKAIRKTQREAQNTTAINSKRSECGATQTALVGLAAGLDKKYLFGDGDLFLNEDMHLHFASKPIALQVNVPDRAQQITDIETKHIDLFYCDKFLYRRIQVSNATPSV